MSNVYLIVCIRTIRTTVALTPWQSTAEGSVNFRKIVYPGNRHVLKILICWWHRGYGWCEKCDTIATEGIFGFDCYDLTSQQRSASWIKGGKKCEKLITRWEDSNSNSYDYIYIYLLNLYRGVYKRFHGRCVGVARLRRHIYS